MSRTEDPRGPGRVLALDLGSRRIGVAMSDELRLIASPLATLERGARRRDREAIRQMVEAHQARAVVVGYPLTPDGGEGQSAREAREFAEYVGEGLHVPVILWDERMTTVEGEETLRQLGYSRRRRRQRIDAAAACLILQEYLDRSRESADPHTPTAKAEGRASGGLPPHSHTGGEVRGAS